MKRKVALPAEFHFCHNYCFFLHDQLLETLISGEKAKIFEIRIKHKSKDEAEEMAKHSGEALVTWLETHGYKNKVRELFYKQICAALLSDFLHFIYEALQCSKKGKLTVAYALLRKPLKDNLFFLEWLLARPAEFLQRFERQNPNGFRLPSKAKEQEQIAIIREAIKATGEGEWIRAEFIHELRFKKNLLYGFEPLWQKANHLVTTFDFLETEPCNFNFVFSNPADRYAQWVGLYWFLPILLYHAVTVVEALLDKFAKRICYEVDIMPLRSTAGLLLCLQKPPVADKMVETQRLFKKQFESAGLKCPKCSAPYVMNKTNLKQFYSAGSISCRNSCGSLNLHFESRKCRNSK
ncbi:MAG TPA: hypothetical protein VMA13_07650 [Candidatus Saccharimonadales bacterium]|nr:hypothetical protein [Candidatus Saccharimonadales bacterium]